MPLIESVENVEINLFLGLKPEKYRLSVLYVNSLQFKFFTSLVIYGL